MIRLTHVSKTFDEGRSYAVKDLSFQVETGETLVLLGSSGCGKTTTLKMINRLIEPSEGLIEVNEKDVRDQDPVDLPIGIGVHRAARADRHCSKSTDRYLGQRTVLHRSVWGSSVVAHIRERIQIDLATCRPRPTGSRAREGHIQVGGSSSQRHSSRSSIEIGRRRGPIGLHLEVGGVHSSRC